MGVEAGHPAAPLSRGVEGPYFKKQHHAGFPRPVPGAVWLSRKESSVFPAKWTITPGSLNAHYQQGSAHGKHCLSKSLCLCLPWDLVAPILQGSLAQLKFLSHLWSGPAAEPLLYPGHKSCAPAVGSTLKISVFISLEGRRKIRTFKPKKMFYHCIC